MITSSKCIPCFFKQAQTTAELVKLSKKDRGKYFSYLTKKLLQFDFSQPPVVFGRTIYKSVSRISGLKDIFAKEKIKVENYLIKNKAYFDKSLKKEKDFLFAAVKLSCLANAIDFGAGNHPNLKDIFSQINNSRLKVNHFDIFRDKLSVSKSILFIGDNCGETFFDRFFIEGVREYKPDAKIFYAVRSAPIINDVLLADAKRMGLDKVAKVFSSGCDYPGIILSKTSAYFKKIYRQVDLVVSKGQGNFESLRDNKDIFYVFQVKCPAVSDFLNLPVYSLLFIYNKDKAFPA